MDKTTHLWSFISGIHGLFTDLNQLKRQDINPVVSCILMDRDGVYNHFNTPRKCDANIQLSAILTEQVLLINDSLHGKRTLLPCGTQQVLPRVQDSRRCQGVTKTTSVITVLNLHSFFHFS